MDYLILIAIVLAGSLIEAAVAFLFALFTPKDAQSEISDAVMKRYDNLFSEGEAPIS